MKLVIALLLIASVPLAAQLTTQKAAPAGSRAQAPTQAPADEWRRFRGSPMLTGVSASTVPATLKVLWTYEAGDIIESSAAVAGGVVYLGGGNGDLVALDFATGKLRW